jgi:anti-sigma B factor antagonist
MAEPHRQPASAAARSPGSPTVTIMVAGRAGAGTLVRIVGRLDAREAPRVARELAAVNRLPRRGPPRLTLDLSGVSYLDDTGLEVLLQLQDRLAAQGGELELQSPTAAGRSAASSRSSSSAIRLRAAAAVHSGSVRADR